MQKKATDRRASMQNAGARWAGLSDGDTPVSSTSSEFIIYSGKTRWRGSSQGMGHDIVILRRSL
jgi:hypothetical protein